MATQTTIGGLYGLLEDILALLPQDEIFILFFEKLDTSLEFSDMLEAFGSQDFGRKFDTIKVRAWFEPIKIFFFFVKKNYGKYKENSFNCFNFLFYRNLMK